MSKYVVAVAIAAAMSVPAAAQTQPAPGVAQTQPPKPLTIKKVVCTRADEEETTGSRLGSAPKVCKTVEVPAPRGGAAGAGQAPASTNSSGN